MDAAHVVSIALAALAAGAVNALAGGGSLLTFPALVAAGLPALVANVTNTVALCPGYLGATFAQRRELVGQGGRVLRLVPFALAGSLAGAWILLHTSERSFQIGVPFLLVFAAGLLAAQDKLRAYVRRRGRGAADGDLAPEFAGAEPSRAGGSSDAFVAASSRSGEERIGAAPRSRANCSALQDHPRRTLGLGGEAAPPGHSLGFALVPICLAAIYGAYFGAGLGVIILGTLAATVDDTLLRMNALKQLLSLVINVCAALVYIVDARVEWTVVAVVAGASLVGGIIGGKLVARIPERVLRGLVIAVALAVAAVYFARLCSRVSLCAREPLCIE